ncbi:hypothetical protein CSKR_100287, partial [Clonorchis sinensis]
RQHTTHEAVENSSTAYDQFCPYRGSSGRCSPKVSICLQMSVFLEISPIWVQVEHKVDGNSGTAPT